MWKPVVGYENIYEVRPGKDGGRVRRIKPIQRSKVGKELFGIDSYGYPRVVLSKPNTKPKHARIHVLILEAFEGQKPHGYEGCHADDVKLNNSLKNLYWGTRSNNLRDSVKNGHHSSAKGFKYQTGEDHSRSKLSNNKREEIALRKLAGESAINLAKEFGVVKKTIYDIVNKFKSCPI